MIKELLMESHAGQTRLALLEDDTLSELYIERKGGEKLVGNIYAGRVMNVLPGMQAAFVDIGLKKNGFLYAGDIQIDQRSLGADAAALTKALAAQSIRSLVKPGQQVLVQVVKEPGGDKGPRLSCNITLPGRMVVLLPTLGYVGVSRRIESERERERLRALAEHIKPEDMGLIVRTAAEGVDEELLRSDITYLTRLWASIEQGARHANPPALLHRDLSLIHRAVRDMLLGDVGGLLIEDEQAFCAAREHAALMPGSLTGRVKRYEGEAGLFDVYRVDSQMEKALARRVWLKSGGYLVFDYAEALTVIDVNTGKYVGKHSLSDTVFEINREAATQIARQLRLRDIGGIVVIDFIDMDDPMHREALLQHFAAELKHDHTKTNLVGLTGLGLVELTRKKVHQPLHTILSEPCPMCQGSGRVMSDETVARDALNQLGACALGEGAWLVEASGGVAGQLMLLGGPRGARTYVCADTARERGTFSIRPVLEHELPRGARPLLPA